MKRSEIRQHIFKIVFRTAFYPQEEWNEQIDLYIEQWIDSLDETWKETHEANEDNNKKEMDYLRQVREAFDSVKQRAEKVMAQIEELDQVIESISEGWKIGRIGKVELAILRVAIFEIQKDEEIPVGVAINEAVELAKVYGTEKSAKFVNGLLAKLV